ncbi:MAG TPA: L-2-hydroxyglutarate oxidase [Solirubrobacteraceae bacterium]|nr:L-2-hydroxyglutarate oxidase [Solirubrobacteraceae bacterium]
MPREEPDIVVVGAGIVGLAVARELLVRRPERTVTVLEREAVAGVHQTGHNAGVLHAGIYYAPGSLKARLCTQGAPELLAYCEERGIPARKDGKLIVALSADEVPRLDELERRGRANGVPGLRRVQPQEIAGIEPHVTGVDALHSPATAVVDFKAVAEAFADDVRTAGGEVVTCCAVEGADVSANRIRIRHAQGECRARFAVFCAGAWSDRLAVAAGGDPDPRIVPFRGAWLRLKPGRRDLVRALVYPVPDPELPFLGVHFTRGVDDEVLIGPTALLAGARDAYDLKRLSARDLRETLGWAGTYRMARKWWRTGLSELRHAVSHRALVEDGARYIPELTVDDVLPGPAGVRAQALGRDGSLVDDFVVSETERALHVRNAPSPAATSSLTLARLIAEQVP